MTTPDPWFTADDFTATPYTSAEEKAAIVNGTIRFLRANTPFTMFTDRLYKAYSTRFGHIAHFNRHIFHDEWVKLVSPRPFLHVVFP
jgi:hypothetical protein